jgi:uncharacterized membrane protein
MLQVFIGFIVIVFLALFVLMSLPMLREQNSKSRKNRSNNATE